MTDKIYWTSLQLEESQPDELGENSYEHLKLFTQEIKILEQKPVCLVSPEELAELRQKAEAYADHKKHIEQAMREAFEAGEIEGERKRKSHLDLVTNNKSADDYIKTKLGEL